MECGNKDYFTPKKKERAVDREFNTALFLYRAFSCGIDINALAEISVGMVTDIFIEKMNDNYEYSYLATQEDIDKL